MPRLRMKRATCHVCEQDAAILKGGAIAKHYRRSPSGGRELCLGAGQQYRPEGTRYAANPYSTEPDSDVHYRSEPHPSS